MIDEFCEYWEILPQASNYEAIGQEIVRYKRNLQDPDVNSMDLSDKVIDFLQQKLLECPYPTNQIILHIIDSKDHEKNQVVEDLLFGTVYKLIDMIIENPYQLDKKFKLYNLLANIYISENKIHKVQSELFPVLYDLKENRHLLDHVLYFVLLSRSSLLILVLYLEYEKSRLLETFDERSIFLNCYYQQKHWLKSVLNYHNDKFIKSKFSPEFYDIITLCKMILDDKDAQKLRAIKDIDESSVKVNNYLHLCFLELSRQNVIFEFLNEHSNANNATFDATKCHILTQLLRLETPFVMENYDTILKLLNYNYENNLKQLEKFGSKYYKDYSIKTEMQLFNEFMVIRLYILKIFQRDHSQESSEICINHIRSLLKTINDGRILYQILQSVFYLVFIRYEHMRKTRLKQNNTEFFNSANPENILNSNDNFEVIIDTFNNQGFICSKETLEIILNSLRLFLMSLDINEAYKNCDDDLKSKFTKLLRNVDIGLWKLSVIEKNDQTKLDQIEKSDEWLLIHDDSLKSIIITESDEEKSDSLKKSSKRKLRKRSKISDTSERSNDKESKDKGNDSLYAAEHSANNVIILENRKRENFISKMLMSPESLAAMCIKNGDEDNLLRIFEDYKLKNSTIRQEYQIIKCYKRTLEQQKLLVAKYEESCRNDLIDIRENSAVDFEMCQIINNLGKFTLPLSNLYEQNDHLLDSLIVELPGLVYYKKESLDIAALIDFIISISSNFYVTKFVTSNLIINFMCENNTESGFYVTFLQKIYKIFGTCQIDKTPMPLITLMNNEIYSFDPITFKTQKNNRYILGDLMKLNVANLNDEHKLQAIETEMKKFNSDIDFFGRILAYVNNVRNMTKYVTNEYLNINEIIKDLNIYELIGKIIYVKQINPEYLERVSLYTNLNLLHAVAIAGGSEFMSPLWKSKRVTDELLSSHNDIKTTEKEFKYFKISSTTILYFIKKSGSFLVAYLIKEIQKFNYQSLKYDEPNFFNRLIQLEPIQVLKQIYGYNAIVAALNYDFIDTNLLLDGIKNLNDDGKLLIISYINERNIDRNKIKFDKLKDDIIEALITGDKAVNVGELIRKIGSVNKFNDLLLKNIEKINSDDELEALLTWSLSVKNQKFIKDDQRNELEEWLKKIKIYRQILNLFKESKASNDITWIYILNMAKNKTSVLINFLINEFTDLDLCNELLKFHPLQERNEEVFEIFIEALNKNQFNDQHDTLFKIIRNYSGKYLFDFYDFSLDYIHNIKSMEYILDYLINIMGGNHVRHQKFQISCIIIKHVDANDRQLWSLSPFPLILIEQLLMNSKIEALNTIVKELRKLLKNHSSCNLCNTTSKDCQIGEILVYDFNAYHTGYRISNDCLDFLFKIYAAKALDFQIIDIPSQTNPSLHSGSSNVVQIHQMPKDIPSKDKWIKDNQAVFCMCCRKSKFSLLNRRHHCRRCGNVICGECSRKRVLLKEKYNDLMVRCCDDCYSQMETMKRKLEQGSSHHEKSRSADFPIEWKLTGDNETDQMIRDEFNFEYSPNVGRCITIICLHTINNEFIDFLLLHCRRLELLLHPIKGRLNPEIDVILVGSMLKYLAKTAKLYGDMGESNLIIEQIDIILKIAESECDSILTKATFNGVTHNLSTREIINELIKLENWKLALDLSVKSDRTAITGVFSAWAISLIKGGQYKLAREKIALALQPVNGSTPKDNQDFMDSIIGALSINNASFEYKRMIRAPKLLCEILEVIEIAVPKHSNSSLTTSFYRNNSSPKNSPKSNENSMDYIKKIMDGDYGSPKKKMTHKFEWDRVELTKSDYFIESMYYLINYGGNGDFLEFFMKNNLIKFALRYTLIQNIPSEMFIQFIIIPIIISGRIVDFINALKQIDGNFIISKKYIDALCKYLERKKSLHVLYQVQLLINDNISAALTRLKNYLDGAGNFIELQENTRYLLDAKSILQNELECTENGSNTNSNEIQLKWDTKTINATINIITLQLEVTKFFSNCELNGYSTLDVIPKLFSDKISLKTLLGKSIEKNQVVILLLICGRIESSFGLCYRIIQECSLNAFKIYSTCTKYLARDLKRLIEVEKLISCIKTNENKTNPEIEKMCDELISMAIEIAYNQHELEAKTLIDRLIRQISSKTIKIECYINSNQLKTAFVHSAAINNLDYINRIYKLAVSTRQDNVKNLCEKKLNKGVMDSSGSENMFG